MHNLYNVAVGITEYQNATGVWQYSTQNDRDNVLSAAYHPH